MGIEVITAMAWFGFGYCVIELIRNYRGKNNDF